MRFLPFKVLILLAISLGWASLSACGDVKTDPGDGGDTTDVVEEDTAIDTAPDTPVDTLEDTVVDTVEPDVVDVVEEELAAECEEAGGYCISVPGSDPCITCTEVDGTPYLPARGFEGAMGCTTTGGDTPYCCLPVDMTSPPECVEGGGGCYRRPGADGLVCPPGWEVTTTMVCGGPNDCCIPGPGC